MWVQKYTLIFGSKLGNGVSENIILDNEVFFPPAKNYTI